MNACAFWTASLPPPPALEVPVLGGVDEPPLEVVGAWEVEELHAAARNATATAVAATRFLPRWRRECGRSRIRVSCRSDGSGAVMFGPIARRVEWLDRKRKDAGAGTGPRHQPSVGAFELGKAS
jgi:hypothetical protein